jgi:prepilin signal peptidase PulO-like enzyme (type II secretory pathway)
LLGVIIGGTLLLFGKIDKKERTMPFGPYIAIAAFWAFISDSWLFSWYLSTIGY